MQTPDSYDQIPYDSAAFSDTHPDYLRSIGLLFGMQPAPANQCRVLELGCATGGNLIPMAYYLPNSEFIGVELSSFQANEAQRWIKDLELSNAHVHTLDLMQIDQQFGSFDYIIAHGIYSWVPPTVQQRILDICRHLLKPQGIAYISYNVKPGWQVRNMTRDILLHATHNETEPAKKLASARRTLEFVSRGISNIDSPASRWMQQEVDYLLQHAAPSYLYHEYLESYNEPLLFSEFIARIQPYQLQYLADTDLHTMFPSSLGATTAALFENISGLIEQEQYGDFIRLRPFRQSLICRNDVHLSREIDLNILNEMQFVADLQTQQTPNLKKQTAQTYRTASGREFTVSHPLTKAALAELAENYPNGALISELATRAEQTVRNVGNAQLAADHGALYDELFNLYLSRGVRLSTNPAKIFNQVTENPRANSLALSQFPRGNATGPRHVDLMLDPFAERLLAACDGSRNVTQLIELLVTQWRTDETLRKIVDCDQNEKRARERIRVNCSQLLKRFARHGLLTQ